MRGEDITAEMLWLSKLGIRLAGHSIYDIEKLDDCSADRIKPIFPKATSEVAVPQTIGTVKKILKADLPAICPAVYNNIIGEPGSSIFRLGQNALLPKDLYHNLNEFCFANENESCIAQESRFALRLGKTKKIEKGVCAFGQGNSNWYHWLVEILPTVLLSQKLPSAFDRHPLLVPESALNIPSFRDTLELCRGDRDVIPLQNSHLYEIGELVYTPPQAAGPFNMQNGLWPEPRHYVQNIDVMQLLRETILQKLNIKRSNDGPKRVFLARQPNSRSYNQTEIISAAQQRGFEPVYLENLSFRDQVQLMHNADYVVGPTGAAFTNTLFMHSGSHSLVWALKEYAGACFFSNLAHASNVNMRYCFVEADSTILNSAQAHIASYKLPIEVFCHHIDTLLEEPSWI